MKVHKLSLAFMQELQQGILHPLLTAVQQDDTLCMELRRGSVNIYYRGGSLYKITQNKNGSYTIYSKYCMDGIEVLASSPAVEEAAGLIPQYKRAIDY